MPRLHRTPSTLFIAHFPGTRINFAFAMFLLIGDWFTGGWANVLLDILGLLILAAALAQIYFAYRRRSLAA